MIQNTASVGKPWPALEELNNAGVELVASPAGKAAVKKMLEEMENEV